MKPSARRRHARIVQDVLAVLVEKYPRCFSLTDDERKPLAIGIGGLDGRDYAGGHAAEINTLGALDQPFQIGATAGVPTQSLADIGRLQLRMLRDDGAADADR